MVKPADRLNNMFQRLKHPLPSYETHEQRTYRVQIHLPAPTLQLVAAPERSALKRLLDRACAGKKAASPQKSKELGIEAVCEALEAILGARDTWSKKGRAKRKRNSPQQQDMVVVKQEDASSNEGGGEGHGSGIGAG